MQRATILVRGRVQGVGFRWWTRARADELGLAGFARNLADGRVEVCAQGDREAIEALRAMIEEEPSRSRRPGRVESCDTRYGPVEEQLDGFEAG